MVRERKSLALPDAVRKMTGLSADHMGLHDRGYIPVSYTHLDVYKRQNEDRPMLWSTVRV